MPKSVVDLGGIIVEETGQIHKTPASVLQAHQPPPSSPSADPKSPPAATSSPTQSTFARTDPVPNSSSSKSANPVLNVEPVLMVPIPFVEPRRVTAQARTNSVLTNSPTTALGSPRTPPTSAHSTMAVKQTWSRNARAIRHVSPSPVEPSVSETTVHALWTVLRVVRSSH
ncbi:hypothetical protein F5H01DRAFT_354565 [Linnemannia elongata]|nr:hypothetical protein F5H01DRAFT_354565 [Linnemannia elongata]